MYTVLVVLGWKIKASPSSHIFFKDTSINVLQAYCSEISFVSAIAEQVADAYTG